MVNLLGLLAFLHGIYKDVGFGVGVNDRFDELRYTVVVSSRKILPYIRDPSFPAQLWDTRSGTIKNVTPKTAATLF
jgi:hypothetical protein